VRRVGGAQHELIVIDQVNQAGIALGKLDNKLNDALQHFVQTQIPNHQPADLLKKTQLLLSPLQAQLKVLALRHVPHYTGGTSTG
jgi:hypothetical protein